MRLQCLALGFRGESDRGRGAGVEGAVAVIGGRVVADGCSSVAVAAPDASTERRVCRSVSGAAAALAAAEWAAGGAAASAAVEAASAAAAAAGATWGAVASGSERAGCRSVREIGGVRAGVAACGLAAAVASCCRVHRAEGGGAVLSGEVAAVAACCADRAADSAAGAARASARDEDTVVEAGTPSTDIGDPAAARAGLSGTSVVSVEGSAAGAAAVPAAVTRHQPGRCAAFAADADDERLARV